HARGGQLEAELTEAEVALAGGGRLRQLAENDELRQRRQGTRPQDRGRRAQLLDHLGPQLEREALVAEGVPVGADVFVAGMSEEHRAGDQLVRAAPDAVAEAPLADVGDRVVLVPLDERSVARLRAAAVVDHRQERAAEERLHRACITAVRDPSTARPGAIRRDLRAVAAQLHAAPLPPLVAGAGEDQRPAVLARAAAEAPRLV